MDIKRQALALLTKLCRHDARFCSILVASLTADFSESPYQLRDLNLTEDLTAADNETKMAIVEFG